MWHCNNGGVEEKAGKETDLNARGYYFLNSKSKQEPKNKDCREQKHINI